MLYCSSLVEAEDQIKHKILIIEDSEFINKTIYTYLTKNRTYTVDTVLNFAKAKELLSKNSYDFILLDLNLPDAFGEELVLEVKSLSEAKIIILTAEEDIHIREALFKNGILDYLLKDKNFSFSLKAIDHTISNVTKNKNKNILVIDDSLFMCKQLQKILKTQNYSVQIALTAADGLKALQTDEVNAIVLDMELPDKHGLDLLREMKDKQEFCHIPVIILSGVYNPEVVRSALKTGASDFIKKPFNVEELTLKVNLAVESNRKHTKVLCTQKMLQEYKTAIDDSSFVSKTNSKGIITYVNDAFCRISGYPREELVGKPHNVVRHPDMPSSTFEEIWKMLQAKQIWKGVIKNRSKDGSSYYVQSTISPILDADDNIVEFIAIRTDVTELETYKDLLQDELNASHNNLLYLKQHEDAMAKFVSVLKTNTDGTIIYTNKNFEKLSGYSEHELLGMKCSDLRAKKHIRDKDCDRVKKSLNGLETVRMTFHNIAKNKKKYITDTTIVPLVNEQSQATEHLHLMYDVTDIVNIHKELEETQKEIIFRLGEVGESRSEETGNHVKRVAEYSRLLALLSGLSDKNANTLYAASPMHDIGKVGIPDAILKKPGRLTDAEFEIMKEHSMIGFNILKKSKRPILKAAAIVSYMHHEKYDGSGYPRGVKGKKIHIYGRITAIADVFDALGSKRVYKDAWELEDILTLFKKESGKHFDPELIDLFLTHLDKFLAIRDSYADEF